MNCFECKKTRCLLEDTPDAAFQVVLHHLSSQDFGSLRQVSKAVCQRTTQHVPYITLLLTDNRDLLQQWHQATRSLQHVSNIHVHVPCKITAEALDAAMQLLSERSKPVTELHLLAVDDVNSRSSRDGACFKPLLPLTHLLPHLHTLVIKGIGVTSMPSSLQQLAAAAATQSWQLKSSALNVDWFDYDKKCTYSIPWLCQLSDFPKACKWLHTAFSSLTSLNIRVPQLEKHTFNKSVHFVDHVAGDSGPDCKAQEHLLHLAVVAMVVNAVLQFNELETLKISAIPDLWTSTLSASPMITTAIAAPAAAIAVVDDFLQQQAGLLSSVSAAAAACVTLDDLGCCMMQHHKKMAHLNLGTTWTDSSMTWQRQQQHLQQVNNTSSRCCPGECSMAPQLFNIELQECSLRQFKHRHCGADAALTLQPVVPGGGGGSSSSSHQVIPPSLVEDLCHYSSRPAIFLAQHISCWQLEVFGTDVNILPDVLGHLKSLKHLKIFISYCYKRDPEATSTADASIAISAAAAVPSLQSFTLLMSGLVVWDAPVLLAAADLLLPLNAAAGGPGSSLKKLRLDGYFSTVTATNPVGDATAGAAESEAAMLSGPIWLDVLLQFDGLCELVIIQSWNKEFLDVPVECLPAGLEVLEGFRLNIMMSTTTIAAHAVGADVAGGSRVSLLSPSGGITGTALPRLRSLTLMECRFSSPSILASHQLHQLELHNSTWSGGWAAATAAWPRVRELVWQCRARTTDGKDCGSADTLCVPSQATVMVAGVDDSNSGPLQQYVQTAVTDIFVGFRALTSFTWRQIPFAWERTNVQQVVVETMTQQAQRTRRAYVWHNTLGYRIQIKCSSVH